MSTFFTGRQMALQSSPLVLVYLIVQVGRESLELLLPVAMLMISANGHRFVSVLPVLSLYGGHD
jgi:hypothetical protein